MKHLFLVALAILLANLVRAQSEYFDKKTFKNYGSSHTELPHSFVFTIYNSNL